MLDLIQRARGGIAVHLALWLLMGAMGNMPSRLPSFFWCVAAAFGANCACRFLFEARVANLSRRRPTVARALFLGLLLANPLLWGMTGVVAVFWPPLHHSLDWILLAVAGIGASGAMALAFDSLVRVTYAPLAVLPTAAALFCTESGDGFFEPIVSTIFLFYIYRASKVVHDDYWSAVQSRIALEGRARVLEQRSVTDALTQVSNRMHFDERLIAEWARARRHTPVRSIITIVMLDIDHFKRINDTYGHPFGDRCLQAVAAALRSALGRPGDLLARFGGEEFVAMLPSTDAAGAAIVSARMHAAVDAIALEHLGATVRLTCSIGVHTMNTLESADPATALDKADQALYQAKRGGRDRVVVFREVEALAEAGA